MVRLMSAPILNREDMYRYVHDTLPYFIALTAIFAFSVSYGMYIYHSDPQAAGSSLSELGEMLSWVASLNMVEIMILIFVNNTLKAFMAIVLGVFIGIFPLYFVAYNGYFIGLVVYDAIQKYSVFYVIAAILPHGIIELPVILFSSAIGIRIGTAVVKALVYGDAPFTGRSRYSAVWLELKSGVSFFRHLLLPLLFVAAVIESVVTPAVVSLII